MSNQSQFVRQTAAVLMTLGLIASLMPGSTAAQDLSAQEACSEETKQRRTNHKINNYPNPKPREPGHEIRKRPR